MLKRRPFVLLLLLVVGSLVGAAPVHGATIPTRTVAVVPNPPGNLPWNDTTMRQAADAAYTAGSRGGVLGWSWSTLEPWPGYVDFSDVDRQLAYPSLLQTGGRSWLLDVEVINVTRKDVPWDLALEPFDSPKFEIRFHGFLDALLLHVTDPRVQYLSIGNEVDAYMFLHPNEWVQYVNFYTDAVNYLHKTAPRFKIGVTTTFGGATSSISASNVAWLNVPSDVYVTTYNQAQIWGTGSYAQLAQGPLTDVPKMVFLAQGKPIVMQEVAFPSATDIGSSEALQAQFTQNLFTAWNAVPVKIVLVTFLQMSDYARSTCTSLQAFYGFWWWPQFVSYFCSVGFLRADGTAKPSSQVFSSGAAAINAGTSIAAGTRTSAAEAAQPLAVPGVPRTPAVPAGALLPPRAPSLPVPAR